MTSVSQPLPTLGTIDNVNCKATRDAFQGMMTRHNKEDVASLVGVATVHVTGRQGVGVFGWNTEYMCVIQSTQVRFHGRTSTSNGRGTESCSVFDTSMSAVYTVHAHPGGDYFHHLSYPVCMTLVLTFRLTLVCGSDGYFESDLTVPGAGLLDVAKPLPTNDTSTT